MGQCTIEGCTNSGKISRGWCPKHYSRWLRHGDPVAPVRLAGGASLREFDRLCAIETDECVRWEHGTSKGYAAVYGPDGLRFQGHIEALRRRVNPPPDKPFACHGPCHDTRCINYRHLYWGDAEQNQRDRWRDGTMPHGETHHNAVPARQRRGGPSWN